MGYADPPSLLPLNVDMLSEACDFEIINKHEDEGKQAKDGGTEKMERQKNRKNLGPSWHNQAPKLTSATARLRPFM